MVVIILLNIGTLFLVHRGQSKLWTKALDVSNLIFTIIYVIEMTLKMSAIGIRSYFRVSNHFLSCVHILGFGVLELAGKYIL